jgi:hypothetical protein
VGVWKALVGLPSLYQRRYWYLLGILFGSGQGSSRDCFTYVVALDMLVCSRQYDVAAGFLAQLTSQKGLVCTLLLADQVARSRGP